MTITYEKAVPADAGRIEELFEEMLRTIFRTEDVSAYGDAGTDGYFGGEDVIFVAREGDFIAAFVSVEVHRGEEYGDYIYLNDFCVTEGYRNRGIGSRLMDMAEEYAASLTISTVALHVEKSNEGARRLYGRRGYGVFRDDGSRVLMTKTI